MREPVRILYVVVSVLIVLGLQTGLIADETSLIESLAAIVPLIVGGEITRANVTPTHNPRLNG